VLDLVAKNFDSWQRHFDPSWFLLMRITNFIINQELERSEDSMPSGDAQDGEDSHLKPFSKGSDGVCCRVAAGSRQGATNAL